MVSDLIECPIQFVFDIGFCPIKHPCDFRDRDTEAIIQMEYFSIQLAFIRKILIDPCKDGMIFGNFLHRQGMNVCDFGEIFKQL